MFMTCFRFGPARKEDADGELQIPSRAIAVDRIGYGTTCNRPTE